MATSYSSGPVPGFASRPACYHADTIAVSSEPRPTYYITRPNGDAVALIPVDELDVKLQSVPRILGPDQICTLIFVGKAPNVGATFKLEVDSAIMPRFKSHPPHGQVHVRTHSDTGTKRFLAPDALARQAYANMSAMSNSVLPKRPVSAVEMSQTWRRSDTPYSIPPSNLIISSADAGQSAIDAILGSQSGFETASRLGYVPKDICLPPSGNIIDQSKKEFCTHWIMTGDCKFEQQGCRYKHEMPCDAKLKELGIRNRPRWWEEMKKKVILSKGEKAGIVGGKVVAPEEWLGKGGSGSEDGDDEGSDSDGEGVVNGSSAQSTKAEVKDTVSRPQLPPPKPVEKVGSRVILKPTFGGSKSPIVPPIRTPSPVLPKALREPSSTGSDLIDFTPIIPAAPTPASSISSKSSSTTTLPSSAPTTPLIKQGKTTRVFVPAGESPETHIADVKKRERTKHASRTSSPATNNKARSAPVKTSTSFKERGNIAEASPQRVRVRCRIRRPASTGITPVASVAGKTAIANAGDSGKKVMKKE